MSTPSLLYRRIVYILAALFTSFVAGFILALPVMYLWNWLMPLIFKLPEVTWLQAWGLTWLLSCLFPKVTITESND